jgi:hypothetical protein
VSRHTHPERKSERRHKARVRAKAAKLDERPRNEYVLRAAIDTPRRHRSSSPGEDERPELTAEQVGLLRKQGLRSPANAAPWIVREVAARPLVRPRGRSR